MTLSRDAVLALRALEFAPMALPTRLLLPESGAPENTMRVLRKSGLVTEVIDGWTLKWRITAKGRDKLYGR